ncbi:diguanylate cyclase (GGDEF) domain-containing protein [Rhizobium sp. NFR07]|uniref:GGDEF domain-containing protein n=1 Tax=Rhizobium sp. NFR07 TaxID=1566262 RepID=UPI0008E43451|nr:GGDEF domain-containing protein [Rhizobium sp. NFR07]SFA74016.1 diguanylate cyclase (GGDEF) domain-containing protein [Rhizobium sp. NFR07]
MNGAVFFLTVNFVVALSFSALFAVVAMRGRSRVASLWLAAGFGVASLSAVSELLVTFGETPKLWAIGAFASVLIGMVLLRVGIGELYGRSLRGSVAAVFIIASMTVCYLIYDLPRGTLLHAFSYQTPFALAVLSSAVVVLNRGRLIADRFLGVVLLVTGLHFFAKAGLAVLVGAGQRAQDYIYTNYALVSQSATAILIVVVGLTLLATLVLEIMADQKTESEVDLLSGLANRRDFERNVQTHLAAMPNGQHTVILCDLDHFKRINDTYGHHVGDVVIQSFGMLLRQHAPERAVVGRIGGEEFALFLPLTDVDVAVLFARALSVATTTMDNLPDGLSVTASFGVSSLNSTTDLAEACRMADMALYQAKSEGRNRVKRAA